MKKRQIRKHNQVETTCRWIVESYAKLLKANPDGKISISQICDKAGIGRTTFYRYYDNTEDIVHDHLNKMNLELLDRLKGVAQPISAATAHTYILTLWTETEHLAALILVPEFASLFSQHFYETRTLLEDHYGLVKINNKYTLAYRQGGLTWFYLEWFKNGMKESPEEMAKMLGEILYG